MSKDNQPVEQQLTDKGLIQIILDHLHSNLTASIVYENPYDYSAGVAGAEVDYFPETADELLSEMGIDLIGQHAHTIQVIENRIAELEKMLAIYPSHLRHKHELRFAKDLLKQLQP